MKFSFLLGKKERIEVRINRNQLTGKFTYSENGAIKIIRSPGDSVTHFPTENPAYYHFAVGSNEIYDIRIVHSWPKLFPAFRPQKYEIYVNGTPLKVITSY